MVEPIAYLIVGLFGVGMGVAFLAADPRSPTSRALSAMWVALGVAVLVNIPASASLARDPSLVRVFGRIYSVLDPLVIITTCEWILRLGRTEVSRYPNRRRGEGVVRLAQGLAVVYGLAGLVEPELRSGFFATSWRTEFLTQPAWYLFALPFVLALALAAWRVSQLLVADIDPAERLRLIGLAAASPFWVAATFLPLRWKPVSTAIGQLIFLVGAVQYHVQQGQRGQFLARFLSPQLAALVRDRGLPGALQRSRVELSVVACDLRGFTAFAESAAPEEVMKLLEDYYGRVGEVVTEFGGSIKDFAGDGVLALVGAPVAYVDHARRAVGMALAIRERAQTVLVTWNRLGLALGVGVGVASGFTTVGTIGGSGRLEYAAVGPAVNLAARGASRAEADQVLVDQRIVGLVGGDAGFHFEPLETTELKGFARPVTLFTVVPADPSSPPTRDRPRPLAEH